MCLCYINNNNDEMSMALLYAFLQSFNENYLNIIKRKKCKYLINEKQNDIIMCYTIIIIWIKM